MPLVLPDRQHRAEVYPKCREGAEESVRASPNLAARHQ
ncbi:MAG: hypothetical protein JWN34_2813 [Bryobacterales bacterium]|nr:hypothetical protein [Bryobacterales bacterium]